MQIPLRHVSSPSEGAHVCLRNGGPHVVLLGGDLPDPGYHMTVAGRSVEGRLRYDYMRPGHESWLALLPTLAYRFDARQVRSGAPLGAGPRRSR